MGAPLDLEGSRLRDRLVDTLVPADSGGHALVVVSHEPGWVPMTDFLAGAGLDRALELTARTRGIEHDRVAAASWFVLSYARLVVSPVVTGWYLVDRVPNTAIANMAIRPDPEGGGAHVLGVLDGACAVLPTDRCVDHPDARPVADEQSLTARMVSTLVDDHMRPLVDAVHGRVRIGGRLPWGNVSHRIVNRFHDLVEAGGSLEKARHGINAVCNAPGSPLRGLSRLDTYTSDETHTLATRLTCCLRYKHPGASMCSTCSLLPFQQRIELGQQADAFKREMSNRSTP